MSQVHQPSKIDILPRNPQNSQNFLLSVFSHRFHRFTQMVRVPSRGCTCLKCTNRARSAPPKISSICVDLCNLWYALCCCGGKDTSATIFRSLTICVDLCNLWEVLPSRSSVNSVQSVGGSLFAWLVHLRQVHPLKLHLCNLWENLPHPNHLCKSVKSVGGHPQQKVL